MSARGSLQKDYSRDYKRESRRGSKMEKMLQPEPETEALAVEEQEEQTSEQETGVWGHWELTANATKKCSVCAAELHGWAYRQDFKFCPFCGSRNAE